MSDVGKFKLPNGELSRVGLVNRIPVASPYKLNMGRTFELGEGIYLDAAVRRKHDFELGRLWLSVGTGIMHSHGRLFQPGHVFDMDGYEDRYQTEVPDIKLEPIELGTKITIGRTMISDIAAPEVLDQIDLRQVSRQHLELELPVRDGNLQNRAIHYPALNIRDMSRYGTSVILE